MNYLTVPASVKELEKIIMIKLPDGKYHLSYALTKTQKTILQAFGMTEEDVTREAVEIAVRGMMILPSYGRDFFQTAVSSFLHATVTRFLHCPVSTFFSLR